VPAGLTWGDGDRGRPVGTVWRCALRSRTWPGAPSMATSRGCTGRASRRIGAAGRDGGLPAALPVRREAMAAFLVPVRRSPASPRRRRRRSSTSRQLCLLQGDRLACCERHLYRHRRRQREVRRFRDGADLPRSELAAFLYRFKGSPAFTPPATSPFVDVPTSHVFYQEIACFRERDLCRTDIGNGKFRVPPGGADGLGGDGRVPAPHQRPAS